MLVKGAGDCEDYSIAKYFTLRRLGIPSEKLRVILHRTVFVITKQTTQTFNLGTGDGALI